MNTFYGYTRVSTLRQGEHGVSLPEQKEAIERYATRKGLNITEWFEEQQTAAKQGRPVFNRMLRLLRAKKAAGVIIHKIDRSARNLKDWAALGELIDSGIAVHFTNDSVDLNSTTGRLSADIQAVVSAHYIRNLREEARKGFYGRLKQGISPMPAVLGYLDTGAGNPKKPDPVKAPLVRKAFALYATGKYSLKALEEKMFELGLRTKSEEKVSDSVLSRLLSNPFYTGVIKIKKTGETYLGAHEALIPKDLFEKVQRVLSGKYVSGHERHEFSFRRLINCKHCGYALKPERQKGHVYYRCHTQNCPTKTIREEVIDAANREALLPLRLQEREMRYLENELHRRDFNWQQENQALVTEIELEISKVKERLNNLTDAYLDGALEKEMFEERKTALIIKRRDLEDKLLITTQKDFSLPKRLQYFFELTKTAYLTYESGSLDQKRRLLEKITSNRVVNCKTVEITLAFPFSEIAARFENSHGGPPRSTSRTWKKLLKKIITGLHSVINQASVPEYSF